MSKQMSQSQFGLMSRRVRPQSEMGSHRHHDIELNYVERGQIVYLFNGQQIKLEQGQFVIFWAAMPHQLIKIETNALLHWLTLPLEIFLRWQLPEMFVDKMLSGELYINSHENQSISDLSRFKAWHHDLFVGKPEQVKIALLEIEARLRRFAIDMNSHPETNT